MSAEKNKLVVTLPSDREILLSRVFDAPKRLVWRAMTEREYIPRWWGCMGEMTVCEIDFRVGGKWRFALRTPQGEVAFNGVYHEIVPLERVVNTEIFEPFPDHPAMVTMTLEERDGKTYYQSLVVHDSKESRDAHVGSGMEVGAGRGLDIIEEIALELARAAA
jgi:uncharacterized protein YndB with AHSA1/START domain